MLTDPRTRRCGRCGEIKALDDFNRSGASGYQAFCRACQRDWYLEHRVKHIENVNANSRRYQRRNREFVRAYLRSHPCVDCGEADPAVLEFDHLADKVIDIASLVRFGAIERLQAEIAKCEVRCANCHMKKTAAQFGWRKGREFGIAEVFQVWD